jgi:tRNA U34 2-thiouridine synthase MnmA/TrmU
MRMVPKRFAVVTFPVLMAGCVLDLNKLAKAIGKPSVSFEQPTAWNCDQTAKLPTKQGVEECTVCRNATKAVQAVTVDKQRQGVNPGQLVYLCPLTVVVEGQAVQP